MHKAPLYHVTVLSNFARAFDKYQAVYRKSAIPESTFPEVFYLLNEGELEVGVRKERALLGKLQIAGDEVLVMQSALALDQVKPNQRNGIGWVWPSPDLPVAALRTVDSQGKLGTAVSVEDVMARSLALHAQAFTPYADIRPRSVSFLPVARGCQAACPFCFSEASVSVEQRPSRWSWELVRQWVVQAYVRGAQRAVITGGGEPTLMPWEDLLKLVCVCRAQFEKVVLITNGLKLVSSDEEQSLLRLQDLRAAGLSVLAVSRHHPDEAINTRIMKIETHTAKLLRVWKRHAAQLDGLRPRLVCVLQRGGVESVADIDAYVHWATDCAVREICFKELYVSTSTESVYHSRAANSWSYENQVPLSLVHQWARGRGFQVAECLPWGAPVFEGELVGRRIKVAAYTEPSLYWERSNGIARSWNVMADGNCLASLEDRMSAVELATAGS